MQRSSQNYFLRHHRQPIIIAHRGASADAPENTLAAFREAIRQKADAIELDVQRSRDKQLVIMHDPWLSRSTNGHGLIGLKTLEQIKKLDASGSHTKYPNEPVPTLEEVLDQFGASTHYIIELKFYQARAQQFVLQVYDAVASRGLLDHALFLSFDPRLLHQLRRLSPRAKTCWAFIPLLGWTPSRKRADRYDVLAIASHQANPRYIRKLQALDKPVSLWMGANEKYDAVLSSQADYLTTNHPAELRAKLNESAKPSKSS